MNFTEAGKKTDMEETKTEAEKLHDAFTIIAKMEIRLEELMSLHEPDVPIADFTISSDWYDNSIEIYLEGGDEIAYPWEPCQKLREEIYAMGFGIVFWNFPGGDEIRGWEPRRGKNMPHKCVPQGYVDERFNEADWTPKYARK